MTMPTLDEIESVFQFSGECHIEEKRVTVRGAQSSIHIRYGPVHFKTDRFEIPMGNRLLIEAWYSQDAKAHRALLPMEGFGAMLIHDYVEAGRNLIEDLCRTKGWTVTDRLLDIPVLRRLVKV